MVTGGGRGVGRGISLGLAEDGADIAIVYRNDREGAEQTAKEIEGLGRGCVLLQGSVDRVEDCRRVAGEAVEAFGFVDILVNNAGIASRGRSVVDTDPEELERVVRVHSLGPHHLCQALVPQMRERPRGDIIMISSVATLSHGANGAPYNMGKAAMESLALTLAKEERPHGIHVNIVAPGLVETEMGRRLAKAVAGVADMRELDATMPFGRVCQPSDVADVVRFLCSERASYLTGEKLNVYGGGQNWR